MEVELTREADKGIERASTLLGMKKQEIIRRAILLYLDDLQKMMDLEKEFQAWDNASDEAFNKFERKL